MLIDVDNVNQVESQKWVSLIFKNTQGTCFIINFSREIAWECSQICQSLQDMLIDVDNVNQWESHILKNTHGTCLTTYFSRKIDREWSQICQRPPSHTHRRRQRQPVRQVGTSFFFKNTHGKYFIPNFSKKIGMI